MRDTDIIRYSCGHEFECEPFFRDGLGRLLVEKERPCGRCVVIEARRLVDQRAARAHAELTGIHNE